MRDRPEIYDAFGQLSEVKPIAIQNSYINALHWNEFYEAQPRNSWRLRLQELRYHAEHGNEGNEGKSYIFKLLGLS